MLRIPMRSNQIGKPALFLPSGYDNPLATANTNAEACLIHIRGISPPNLVLVHRSLLFVKELPDLLDIHSTLFLQFN